MYGLLSFLITHVIYIYAFGGINLRNKNNYINGIITYIVAFIVMYVYSIAIKDNIINILSQIYTFLLYTMVWSSASYYGDNMNKERFKCFIGMHANSTNIIINFITMMMVII